MSVNVFEMAFTQNANLEKKSTDNTKSVTKRIVNKALKESNLTSKSKIVDTAKNSIPLNKIGFTEDIDDIDMEDTVDTSEEVTSDYPDDLNFVIRTMFKECQDKELKSQVKSVIAEYGKLNDVDEDGLKKIYDMMK